MDELLSSLLDKNLKKTLCNSLPSIFYSQWGQGRALWVIHATSFTSPDVAMCAAHQTINFVGFIINLRKSEPSPSQDFTYIVGQLRMDLGKVFLPVPHTESLLACIRTFFNYGWASTNQPTSSYPYVA